MYAYLFRYSLAHKVTGPGNRRMYFYTTSCTRRCSVTWSGYCSVMFAYSRYGRFQSASDEKTKRLLLKSSSRGVNERRVGFRRSASCPAQPHHENRPRSRRILRHCTYDVRLGLYGVWQTSRRADTREIKRITRRPADRKRTCVRCRGGRARVGFVGRLRGIVPSFP